VYLIGELFQFLVSNTNPMASFLTVTPKATKSLLEGYLVVSAPESNHHGDLIRIVL
jgi:hypothetical protein